MEGKNGELEKLKAEMEAKAAAAGRPDLSIKEMGVAVADAPVEVSSSGWRVSVPIAGTEAPAPAAAPKAEAAPAPDAPKLNKAVEDVKEGDVSSIASRKVVYGAARAAMLGKQRRDFEARTGKQPMIDETEPSPAAPEEASPAAEKFLETKAEWKAARERAHALDAEYRQKYHDHILAQSEGLKYWANMPRRMLGLRPKLPAELEALAGASVIARRDYRAAAERLKNEKAAVHESHGQNEKLVERYQRLLAYHLVVGVYRERLQAEEAAAAEAWQANRFRPAMEKLRKYKYARIGAMTLGYAVLGGATGGLGAAAVGGGAYLSRIAAAMGLGAGAGLGGQALYVEPLRRRLSAAREQAGDDFFRKDFLAADRELEQLTFGVRDREARVRTAAMAAGLATGLGTGQLGFEVPSMVENGPVGADESLSPLPADETLSPLPSHGDKIIAPVAPGAGEHLTAVPPADTLAPAAPDSSLPAEAPRPEARPEVVPSPTIAPDASEPGIAAEVPAKYTVVKGDNVWNILEGKGPDAHPVGGQSEVLKDMPVADRQAALDKLIAYYEDHPEAAAAAGAVKSGGNIHRIYPGEQLDIAALDGKLRELLGSDASLPAEAPLPEARPEADAAEVPPEPSPEVAEAVTDINQLTIGEFIQLGADVAVMNPEATARLAELGMDTDTFMDMFRSLNDRLVAGDLDHSLTVSEFLNSTVKAPAISEDGPAVTPFDGHLPQPGDMPVREASAIAEMLPDAAVENYVADVEKSTRGWIFAGQPSVAGTFDRLKDLSFGEIKALAGSGRLPEGVSQDGWSRWVDTVNESVKSVPSAGDNETLGEYVARAAGTRTA